MQLEIKAAAITSKYLKKSKIKAYEKILKRQLSEHLKKIIKLVIHTHMLYILYIYI